MTPAGIPHPSGTKTTKLTVEHKGETHTIHVRADHNGSRVKVEFPDGETAYTEGWDETERALQAPRPMVNCPVCDAANVLAAGGFDCSACGTHVALELRTSVEGASAADNSDVG